MVQNLGVDDKLDAKARIRKLGCPFELIGWRDRKTQKWHLRVECGSHNHEVGTSMDGYASASRMIEAQNIDVRKVDLADIDPK